MIKIFCDICKKDIVGATTAYSWDKQKVNYRTVLDKALCPECNQAFEQEVRDSIAASPEFGLLDHNRVLKETLDRMTQ